MHVPGDPSVVELDSSALCNATVSVEVASKMYKAVLHSMDDKGSAGPNSTSYFLKYKKKVGSRGKAKANGWVDSCRLRAPSWRKMQLVEA